MDSGNGHYLIDRWMSETIQRINLINSLQDNTLRTDVRNSVVSSNHVANSFNHNRFDIDVI